MTPSYLHIALCSYNSSYKKITQVCYFCITYSFFLSVYHVKLSKKRKEKQMKLTKVGLFLDFPSNIWLVEQVHQ